MSKTTTAGMDAHLAEVATSLATCWRIERTDGQVFTFTSTDRDLVGIDIGFGAETYQASSALSATAIKTDDSLGVDQLAVQGVLDSTQIDEEELRIGLFDNADVWVFLVNFLDLSDGEIAMRKGVLGEVTLTKRDNFFAELRGLAQAFQTRIGEPYEAVCQADLGDSRCKIPLVPDDVQRNTAYVVGDYVKVVTSGTPDGTWFDYEDRIYQCTTAGTTAGVEPAYDTTIGNTTTDGTAVFTTEASWTRAVEIKTVTQQQKEFTTDNLTPVGVDAREQFPTGWFDFGAVFFETGDNAGRAMEVRTFTQDSPSPDQTVRLFLDMPKDLAVGDRGRIYPGCDKLRTTCRDKFANIENFRGFPDIPGQDTVLDYPNAKT